MSFRHAAAFFCVTFASGVAAGPALALSDVECTVPAGFVETSPPPVEAEKLVTHTEEITINRPLAAVMVEGNRTPIEKAMHGTSSLPGVKGTHMLRGTWPEAGAHRVTCLTDGGSTEEQVLVNTHEGHVHHFRYEVWNYTTVQARPVSYAVGDFLETDLGDGRTLIHWTYGFRLRSDRFPGYFGPFAPFLFHTFFLDTRYAELMHGALAVRKHDAEQLPASSAAP